MNGQLAELLVIGLSFGIKWVAKEVEIKSMQLKKQDLNHDRLAGFLPQN